MSDCGVCDLLKETGEKSTAELELAAVRVQEQDGFQDAEMGLLVDNPKSRCLFLRCLHSALITNGKMDDTDEAIIRRDLRRWEIKVEATLSNDDLANWLKFAIERYSFRLSIAIDKESWSKGGKSPLDDAFWFNGDARKDTPRVAQPKTENGLITWSTPDPRDWKGDPWMRFFGKRICWIDKLEVEGVLNPSDLNAFCKACFPGFRFEPPPKKWEALALWLRLKWLEHLAKRVRGLERVDGITAIRLGVAKQDTDSISYIPATLPYTGTQTERQGGINSDSTCNHVPQLKTYKDPNGEQWCGITFCFQSSCDQRPLWGGYGLHLLQRKVGDNGQWDVEESPLFYGAKLSGALPSATSFAELSRESKSLRAARFFLLLVEESLLRMVVVDERAQAWVANDAESAGAAAQRGIFVSWLDGEGQHNQPACPMHQIWSVLKRNPVLSLTVPEKISNNNKPRDLVTAIRGETPLDGLWPIAGEVLLIHQGILDKAFKKDVATWVADLKDDIPFVAVTSGRGKPDTVPYGVRFLPFSGVQACIASKVLDKTLLVSQLMALGGET